MKNTVSGGGITRALGRSVINAPDGNIISRTTQRFINSTKVSDPISGRTHKLKDLLKKPTINKKLVEDIFAQAENKGILREKPWTKTSSRFFEKATQEDKKITVEEMKRTKESQNIPAKNKQPETVKPKDEKVLNIAQAQKETAKAERWRGAALGGEKAIRGMERVYAGGKEYRKQQAAISELTVISRGGGGMAAEGKPAGLLNKAMEEKKDEKNSPKGDKSGQKNGKSASKEQKSGGHQGLELKGMAGIDELTHPKETSGDENIPTGGIQVKELENKPPASQPEAPPVQKSAPTPIPAPEDPDELNI